MSRVLSVRSKLILLLHCVIGEMDKPEVSTDIVFSYKKDHQVDGLVRAGHHWKVKAFR